MFLFRRAAPRDSLATLPGFETERLRVAALVARDAEALRRLTDDPAITGAVDFLPEPFTLADARGLIASARRGSDRFNGVWEREGRALVAVVGTHLRGEGAVEIGYWVGGAARGRGIATEAVAGILDLLARRFPHRSVVAECRPGNVASWGLLRKLGFRDTGEEGHRPGRRLLMLARP
ncbi:GNAT family N-acetyltransferase [Methylobacterium oxalidis]|uniref:N-acetyltransferase n=1 Tax=Methylobacterium oxalidis TaxID=944322 RepID=A0A512J228_9HYPH|nr:GNAT family N-acetyltransferase [Methylobacterium oxalidis]GEP03983.1 N-acetyltransferase [Methylobacterium oxalidis]GJE31555.1 Acetyltransferase [Methylobacterium oxalidis]GLS64015.1 N-acetyltransferase [Methylobacterium oxalidis]